MGCNTRVLAVAVATGRIACVFLIDGQLKDWRQSRIAALNTKTATRVVQSWIDDLGPDLLISEHPDTAHRKGRRAKAILQTIGEVFDAAEGLNVQLARTQGYQNKYEEAKALIKKYPELLPWLPLKPPIWLPEPRQTMYFEALSLVEQVTAKPKE